MKQHLRRFLAHRANVFGLILVLGFIFVAAAAPVLSPLDEKDPGPYKQVGRFTDMEPHPPSQQSPLGTLPGQLDIYHSIVWGSRNAIEFGLLVSLTAFLFGIVYGAFSGYLGGAANNILIRLADIFLVIPVIVATVMIRQLIGYVINMAGGEYYFDLQLRQMVADFTNVPSSLVVILTRIDPLLISLVLLTWMPYARVTNTLVVTLRQAEFIQASRALGGGSFWVVFRHLIPNSISPTLVLAARDFGSAVIIQATFTFIGLAGNSPWGALLSFGRDWIIAPGGNMLKYWWLFLPPTVVVILFGVSWNMLGDGINDLLDPRT
jgi:peptide/nickel transport system permease protein